jgi:hypothetical protein
LRDQSQKNFTRQRSGSNAVKDTPGNPQQLSSFVDVYTHETHTAAYLGFNDIVEFRKLVLRPDILCVYVMFTENVGRMSKHKSLELIRDASQCFERLDKSPDLYARWPQYSHASGRELSADEDFSNAAHRLAYVLVAMYRCLSTAPIELNFSREFEAHRRQQFKRVTNVDINKLMPCIGMFPAYQWPWYRGESELEDFTRVWNLLKHMHHIIKTNKADLFRTRYAKEALKVPIRIAEYEKPHWMRENTTEPDEQMSVMTSSHDTSLQSEISGVRLESETIMKQETEVKAIKVERADRGIAVHGLATAQLVESQNGSSHAAKYVQLSPALNSIVTWIQKSQSFARLMEIFENHGLDIPSSTQKLGIDPRCCSKDECLNTIRRQYLCQQNRSDLEVVTLFYKLRGDPATINLLSHDWAEVQRTFDNKEASDFNIKLHMKPAVIELE